MYGEISLAGIQIRDTSNSDCRMRIADLNPILFLFMQRHLFIPNSTFRNPHLPMGGEEG